MKIKLNHVLFCLRRKLLINMMRTFIFLCFTGAFSFTPSNLLSQNAKIKIESDKTLTVDEVFDLIMQQTDYKFMYQEGIFNDFPKVEVKKGTILANKLLEKSLSSGNFVLSVGTDNTVVVKEQIVINKLQLYQVKGVVKDQFGQPLPGATVIEKGTQNGAQTDFDGKYSLELKNTDATLVISYIGFATQEILVNNRIEIDVILKESASSLDEIVVIGYGTAKKSDLTGAVASADLKTAKESSNVSIIQALQGSVAGLNVGTVTSAGGNPSLSVRGQSTLSSSQGDNQPLIVLDGIIYRGNLVDINPSDIKSIDILKDASSAAIYGSQASNGVIVITSKGGGKSNVPTFNYSTSYTVQLPANKFEPMAAAEYEEFYQDVFWAGGGRLAPDFLQADPNYDFTTNFKTNAIATGFASGEDNRWNDLLTGNGVIQTHNINIQGNNEDLGYFVSLGLTDQDGYIKGDDYKRYNFRVNLDAKINDWLNIGTQTFITVSDYSGQSADYNGQQAYYFLQPWAPITDDAGSFITNPEGNWLNPFLALEVDDSDIRFNLSNVMYANIKLPIDGLSYKLNYANNYRTTDLARFDPSASNFQGTAFKNNTRNRDWTVDNILNYTKSFNNVHNINATLVYGAEKRQLSGTNAASSNFEVDLLGYNNLAAGDPTLNKVSSSKEAETSLYQMGRLLYNYDNKYFFTGTIRRDGFSGFGVNDKTALFPSVAAGWVITNEAFADDSSWLNYLKLRASYGQSGRRGLGRYDTLASVSSSPSVVFGDGGQTFLGQEIKSLSNPSLTWETTTGTNLALDFRIFNSRINGTLDYYQNKTENILFQISLPEITGFNNINDNVAEVSNYGIELTLNSQIINTESFSWDMSLNFNLAIPRKKA